MQSILLDPGVAALATAIAEGVQIRVNSFQVGSAANFTPTSGMTGAQPIATYTGDASTIATSVINNNEVRYAVTIVESLGPFSIGNIVLFIEDQNSNVIPFLMGVLPVPVPKYVNNPPLSIGNRLVFNLTCEFTNVSQAFTLEVVTPTYSSLPSYRDENDLPIPTLASYQQSILQNTTVTGSPAMVARRTVDDTWFINTLFQRLDDPYFGTISGGMVGDNYIPFYGKYTNGGLYISSNYNNSIDGGENWAIPNDIQLPLNGGSY